jgi:type I restriction enzyme M protein
MKELKREDIMSVEAIEQQIWKMFDILRSHIAAEDYDVVLFLLHLHYGSNSTSRLNDPYDQIEEYIYNFDPSDITQFKNTYERTYKSIIERISRDGLIQILDLVFKIDREVLNQYFPEIFDRILYRITQSQGRFGGQFIQPLELTRFICALADLPKKSKVFNPFAGLASFGVFLDQDQDYFGQEVDQKTWSLGTLRILAFKRTTHSHYVCDDSILRWPKEDEKFDLVVANPPYRMRLNQQYREVEPSIRTVEQFLIEKGVNSLNTKGKLIALLPQGFLFRGMHEQRLREHLIEEDLIDTIISLPGGLLLNTGTPLVILVINKGKRIAGKVRFIDAKKFITGKRLRDKKLDDLSLNSFIGGDKEDESVLRIATNEQIRANNYNLNVARYFQKKIDGIKLGDILEFVRGQRGNLPEAGKLIRIQDLKDDKVDFTLDLFSVGEAELSSPNFRRISESCLLLATRWKALKPSLFEFKGEPIYTRGQDILSFRVDESIADKAFLINELHADYVQEQLDSYRTNTVIQSIRSEDLMEVVVKLPSLQEQRAKVQGIYELSDKIKKLQKERNALAHGKSIKQFNEFASLKHTLGRPRQNILDWSDNLLHFFNTEKEGFDALNTAFAKFYDIDIISVLKEVKRDVNFITDVLEKGENGLVLAEYEKQLIPLSDINSLINNLSNNGFTFKIKKLLLQGEKLNERGIHANKTLFKTLLDNILTNANKYAFDKSAAGNEVVIELTEVDDSLSMEIKNNGKHFPKNFDREKFITKYSTADLTNGSGLGGYDIHRIATDFNNADWVLSLNEDLFFPVQFKFQFPVKLIN